MSPSNDDGFDPSDPSDPLSNYMIQSTDGPITWADTLSGLYLSGKYLYVLSKDSSIVFRFGVQDNGLVIEDSQLLLADAFEGIAISSDGETIYLIGEDGDAAEEFDAYRLPVADYDFDGDGYFDANDIDMLGVAIAVGSTDPMYDVDNSGSVMKADFNFYVESFLYTYLGDANLDRTVNVTDLNVVGVHWQQSVTTWSDGDFNHDDMVDAIDMNSVGSHWTQTKL